MVLSNMAVKSWSAHYMVALAWKAYVEMRWAAPNPFLKQIQHLPPVLSSAAVFTQAGR
jgi:hypothetical protein